MSYQPCAGARQRQKPRLDVTAMDRQHAAHGAARPRRQRRGGIGGGGERAERVRWIFTRFLEIGSTTELAREALARGIRNRNGNRMDKKYIYRLLGNRAYIGEAVHKGKSYPGEHDAIIDRETWDRVHAILTESPRTRAANTRTETPALLKGLLYGPDGAAFSPSHTRKGDRLYRYYVSQSVLKHGAGSCPIGRVPAPASPCARVVPASPSRPSSTNPMRFRVSIASARLVTRR